MNINPNIFRAYDIRGIYQQDLTSETAELIGKGFGTYLGGNKKVVVGRDNRIHGKDLQEAFIKGLVFTGCQVTNISLSPSPYLYFVNSSQKYGAGCNVTASHNPSEYNGFKLVGEQGYSICGKEIQKIKDIIIAGDFLKVSGGRIEELDFKNDYTVKLQELFTFKKSLKVVVDSGNGVSGKLYPDIIRALGHEVIELYTELDGTFPNHQPDPIVESNTKDLKIRVRESQADVGFSFDGDGDRMTVIDEQGTFYNSDQTLILLARDLLTRNLGAKIVFTVSNSQILFSDIKEHGGVPIMTAVGHSFVENTMTKEGALLGGEQSGHFFIKENYYSFDDALVAALTMLQIREQADQPFSEIYAQIPETFIEPEDRPYVPDERKFILISEIADYFKEKYPCNTLDGVRIDFGNDAWAGIRASNTSPCISICLEAKSKEKLAKIKEIVYNKLNNFKELNLKFKHI